MTFQRTNRHGVALVTTVIMLSIVTIMAVAFLGVTRRERASVVASTDFTTARQLATMASERATAEVVSRMVRDNAIQSIDFLVSTNYQNPRGFTPGVANAGNVNYFFRDNGSSLTANDQIQNIANLQLDPRPPVFFSSIVNNRPTNEFRFFLDLNRNRGFEDTGLVRISRNGAITDEFQLLSGDPQWIGVLENPDFPHSATNRFIGRYLYFALPTGRSLDLNYIHNQSKMSATRGDVDLEGFYRNEGVGSWEINLAAFLRELNTNFWDYSYNTNIGGSSFGRAFNDAHDLTMYRYQRRDPVSGALLRGYQALETPFEHFTSIDSKPAMLRAFRTDGVDNYGDGIIIQNNGLGDDDDEPVAREWAGSGSPQLYYDPQELFSRGRPYSLTSVDSPRGGFAWRLTQSMTNLVLNDTDNRYTFYKMLSQLGVDSLPAHRDRIHLNYDNRSQLANPVTLPPGDVRFRTSEFLPWDPRIQFIEMADRLLKERFGQALPGISMTNIALFPNNIYGAEIHQVLQMCANIVDSNFHGEATEQRQVRLSDDDVFTFPMVFKPALATGADGSIFITDWILLGPNGNRAVMNEPWYDLENTDDVSRLQSGFQPNANIYGVPYVVAYRSRVPQFNEVLFETHAQVTRKVAVSKRSPFETFDRPKVFQQLHYLSISNVVGYEVWNAFRSSFPRTLTMVATNDFGIGIFNRGQLVRTRNFTRSNIEEVPAGSWAPASDSTFATTSIKDPSFRMPILGDYISATNELFLTSNNSLSATSESIFEDNLLPVQIELAVTNRVTYLMFDEETGHILDFVNLTPMRNTYQLSTELQNQSNFWLTNSFNYAQATTAINEGIANQVTESLNGAANDWRPHSQDAIDGDDKAKAIQAFQEFMGVSSGTGGRTSIPRTTRSMQLPYSPTSKFRWRTILQANDPFVHYTLADLNDIARPGDQAQFIPLTQLNSTVVTNNNLLALNNRYDPWGGNPANSAPQSSMNASNDPRNPALKDPGVTEPSLFSFPENNKTLGHKYANIGALGAIHRGTPWQTIYLKSEGPDNNRITDQIWQNWSGHQQFRFTHPTNDWAVLGHFTTSLNDNSTRGLLSVNQTNRAAWSAIFGGIRLRSTAAEPIEDQVITPATDEIYSIIDGINAARNRIPPNTPGGLSLFPNMGSVLSTPELTFLSPYLGDYRNGAVTDEVFEAIPRKILSLLKADDPRVVVYAYGQALRPADRSVVARADQFNGLVTNYIPTSEYVTKTLIEFYFDQNGTLRHRTEDFSLISPTE